MNITHVVPYMHPHAGGPPVVVDRVCRRLAARGHTVTVLTTDAYAAGQTGWEAAFTGGGYALAVHRSSGGAFAYSPSLRAALPRAVGASDLVHLHTLWTYPTLRAAWACRRLGVPYVVMPHGMLDPHSVRRRRLKKWAYLRLAEGPNLRRAAAIHFTHPEEERLARETLVGLPRGWITPLAADDPPAPRAALAREFAAEFPALAAGPVLLFLGRLHAKKGLDVLLPAFSRVAQRLPDVRLVIAGPGEPGYVAALERTAAATAPGRVAFLGPLAGRRKWAAYAAAAAFVLPSHQENFAITVVEALRSGTPVVLSRNVNIWADVVAAGGGVTAEVEPRALAEVLVRVLADPAGAGRAGEAGRRFADATYTWDRTADAVEEAYRGVLAGRQRECVPR